MSTQNVRANTNNKNYPAAKEPPSKWPKYTFIMLMIAGGSAAFAGIGLAGWLAPEFFKHLTVVQGQIIFGVSAGVSTIALTILGQGWLRNHLRERQREQEEAIPKEIDRLLKEANEENKTLTQKTRLYCQAAKLATNPSQKFRLLNEAFDYVSQKVKSISQEQEPFNADKKICYEDIAEVLSDIGSLSDGMPLGFADLQEKVNAEYFKL